MTPSAEERARRVCANIPTTLDMGSFAVIAEALAQAYADGERAGAEREREACAKVMSDRVRELRAEQEAAEAEEDDAWFEAIGEIAESMEAVEATIRRRANGGQGK